MYYYPTRIGDTIWLEPLSFSLVMSIRYKSLLPLHRLIGFTYFVACLRSGGHNNFNHHMTCLEVIKEITYGLCIDLIPIQNLILEHRTELNTCLERWWRFGAKQSTRTCGTGSGSFYKWRSKWNTPHSLQLNCGFIQIEVHRRITIFYPLQQCLCL